jgi:hypothetical protein
MKSNFKKFLTVAGIISVLSSGTILTLKVNAKSKDNVSNYTQIVTQVPSMETKINGKQNPVWVPTLHWVINAFERYMLKGKTLKLEKNSNDLNEVQKLVGQNDLENDEYVAMAGKTTTEWVKKLNVEIKKRFPKERDKEFTKDINMAYSLIIKDLKFDIPFPKFKNKINWNGKKVDGWGINYKYDMIEEKVPMKDDKVKIQDSHPVSPLKQVDYLWYSKDKGKEADFGIDFNLKDKHKDTKVYVFQYIDNKPKTLNEAWNLSLERQKSQKYKLKGISVADSL